MKANQLMSKPLKAKIKSTKRDYQSENTEMFRFRGYLSDMIKKRQYDRKPVTVKFVMRTARARLKELAKMNINLTKRGRPLVACKSWCWAVLIRSGNSSRARGKGLASTIKV